MHIGGQQDNIFQYIISMQCHFKLYNVVRNLVAFLLVQLLPCTTYTQHGICPIGVPMG
jgi:hypothetical protein